MKRTTVTLPQTKVRALLEITEAKNKTQAVIRAIDDEIRYKRIQRIQESAGKLDFIATAHQLRHGDERLG